MRLGIVLRCSMVMGLLAFDQSRAQHDNPIMPISAPVNSGFRCESRVFVYLDKSASLSSSERVKLAENLGRVLQSSEGPISDHKYVYLRSFAGILGRREEIAPDVGGQGAQIARKVKDIFSRQEAISEGQSNIVNVLTDIRNTLEILRETQVKGGVFVVASDFIHDQTDDEDNLSWRTDWDGWQSSTDDHSALWQALSAEFRDQREGHVLLLLPLEGKDNPLRIGKRVLARLKALTNYDGQVTEKGALDIQGLVRFLKPLSVRSEIEKVGVNFFHSVRIENHSCFNLPPLRVRLSPGGVNGYDDFDRLSEGVFRSQQPIRTPLNPSEPESRPSADFTLHVQLDGVATPVDLQVQDINTEEYIFLTELSLAPNETNTSFRGHALFSQLYWHKGLKVALTLKNREESIGPPVEHSFREILSLEPSPVPINNVTIKVGKLLTDICYQAHWKDGRLKLEIKAHPGNAGIQRYLLPVKIINPDGQKDLLEDLAQQGSLPALGALATMLLMFARRRSVGMDDVEKTVAVVGLFWITIFLLMHHVPAIGVRMDVLLSGTPARIIGSTICVLLAGFIYMLLRKGAIGPARDSTEIMLEAEKRASGIPFGPDSKVGLLRRCVFFLSRRPEKSLNLDFLGISLLVFLSLAVGLGLLLDPPEPECRLELAEAISVHN